MLLECAMEKQVQQYQQNDGVLAGDKIIDVPWRLETYAAGTMIKLFRRIFAREVQFNDIFCSVLTNVMLTRMAYIFTNVEKVGLSFIIYSQLNW